MKYSTMFNDAQANTLNCLRKISESNEKRKQEMLDWLNQAVISGRMESILANSENIPFEELTTVAKICVECKSLEEIHNRILSEVAQTTKDPLNMTSTIEILDEGTIIDAKPIDDNETKPTDTDKPQGKQVDNEETKKTAKPKTPKRAPFIINRFELEGGIYEERYMISRKAEEAYNKKRAKEKVAEEAQKDQEIKEEITTKYGLEKAKKSTRKAKSKTEKSVKLDDFDNAMER